MYQYCTRVPVTEIIKYYIYCGMLSYGVHTVYRTGVQYDIKKIHRRRMGDTSVYFFIPDFFVGLFEATDFYQKFGCRW